MNLMWLNGRKIEMFDFSNVKEVKLSKGAHDSPEQGMCFMEMAAWFAGEEHSDKPKCVSPSLGRFGIALNDKMDSEIRDRVLKPMIPHVVGTTDGEAEGRRVSYICLRAFNYTAGLVDPDFMGQYGPARNIHDAREMGREIGRRNDPKYGRTNPVRDRDFGRKLETLELVARVGRDTYDGGYPISPMFEPNEMITSNMRSNVFSGDLDAAIGLFIIASRTVHDWSAAIDTLREAIKLGRHDGFDVTVNLDRRHKELAKLPKAKAKDIAYQV